MKIAMAILDRYGRPLESLRISVTDRCNLRCHYCMPEPDYAWLPKETLLSFEEIGAIVDAFTASAWIACGSPAANRCFAGTCRRSSIQLAGARPAIRDLALTTNGVLLAPQAAALRARRPSSHHRQPRHAGPRRGSAA